MSNPFERRFSSRPPDESEPPKNTDGGSATDGFPYDIKPDKPTEQLPNPEPIGPGLDRFMSANHDEHLKEYRARFLSPEEPGGFPGVGELIDKYFDAHGQHFEKHHLFPEYQRLNKQLETVRQEMTRSIRAANDKSLQLREKALEDQVTRIWNEIESSFSNEAPINAPTLPPEQGQQKESYLEDQDDASEKRELVSIIDDAAFEAEELGMPDDAKWFNNLSAQIWKSKETPTRIPLWYFDKNTSKKWGRVFDRNGTEVFRYAKKKELEGYLAGKDTSKLIILPNYQPSPESQEILLRRLGVERRLQENSSHMSLGTSKVKGHYEQLGPAKNPFVAYLHLHK